MTFVLIIGRTHYAIVSQRPLICQYLREGRERGDNVPWRPTYKYKGDIADTEALKKWIESTAVPLSIKKKA